jgi:phosphoserine aminotransferase
MSGRTFFTVGPSQLYPTVKEHLREAIEADIPSISHRGAQFMEMYESVASGLKTLMGIPDDFHIFFLSSGTEGMERVIENCVGAKSAHVVYGSFSKRWMAASKSLGKATEEYTVPMGEIPSLSDTAFSEDAELICITQNETSTGGAIAPADFALLRKKYPNALVGVDAVSSAPAVPLPWANVDCVFFSVQKCLGLPAGLALLVVSPRAFAKSEEVAKQMSVGSYHTFAELKKYADKKQTPETPNVLAVYLLEKVLKDMNVEGIEAVVGATERKAKKLYDFLASQKKFTPFVKKPEGQSETTIAVTVEGGSKPVIDALKADGLIVGSGYGEFKEKHIRIANFPAHTEEDFDRLISALKALSV